MTERIRITPLQRLLLEEIEAPARVLQVTGRERITLWRWKTGASSPERADAEKLIELFGAERLDFNGCYVADIEITEDEAVRYKLRKAQASPA